MRSWTALLYWGTFFSCDKFDFMTNSNRWPPRWSCMKDRKKGKEENTRLVLGAQWQWNNGDVGSLGIAGREWLNEIWFSGLIPQEFEETANVLNQPRVWCREEWDTASMELEVLRVEVWGRHLKEEPVTCRCMRAQAVSDSSWLHGPVAWPAPLTVGFSWKECWSV